MGKKHKKKLAEDTEVIQASPIQQSVSQPKRPIKNIWIKVILVAVVLLMYGNSVNYEFTVDDSLFYVKHSSVQKGLAGIPETFAYGSLEKYNGMQGLQPYRPVTLISFAIQKQLFNNDPAKAHLVNVLLYALLVLVLFNLLLKLLPSANPIICGIIALVFAVHPVHTEVVASVKSQDELLSVLFTLLAFSYAASLIKADKFSVKLSGLSILFYSLALFSKEGTFAMLLIFPLAFWLLLSQSVKRSLVYSLPYLGVGLFFLFARHLVLNGQVQNYNNTVLENVLIGANGFAEVTATKMEILFHYLRLFFIPWPLSWDYSFNQVPVVNWSSLTAWFSLIAYTGMLVMAIVYIRKKPVISFGIIFFLIMLAPTANLFFLNGSTLSERFLFFPSLGLIIAVVYIIANLFKLNPASYTGAGRQKFSWLFGAVIIIFAGLTISRSSDWRSNLSIFKAGVVYAPNSSRTNATLAQTYYKLSEKEANVKIKADYLANSLKYTKASLAILPANRDALYNMALTHKAMGDRVKAVDSYRNLLDLYPDHRSGLTNLGTLFFEEQKFDSAYVYFKRSFDTDTTFPKSSQNLAIYYLTIGNYNKAIEFGTNAIRLYKYQVLSYDVISNAYKALGNEAEAKRYRQLYGEMNAEMSDLNNTAE